MRILLSCIHYPVAAGRFVYWALRRMGHEVVTVGPAAGAYLPWANGHNMEPYEWKPDVALSYPGLGNQMVIDSEDALARLSKPPDLIIQMDAHFMLSGKAPCPNVLYAIDNHMTGYGAQAEFDRIFVAHSWGAMAELPHAEWLPCAYDPKVHYVIDEHAERPADAMMLGNGYPERVELGRRLVAAGLKVYFYGGAIYEAYNGAYNHAKVAVCRSVAGDVAMRVFENMAQGCLVVTDRAHDLAACGFEEDVHYLGYDTPGECVERVAWALRHWEAASKMIVAARETVKPHTWQARAGVLCSVI